jgi:hypothetical protein
MLGHSGSVLPQVTVIVPPSVTLSVRAPQRTLSKLSVSFLTRT